MGYTALYSVSLSHLTTPAQFQRGRHQKRQHQTSPDRLKHAKHNNTESKKLAGGCSHMKGETCIRSQTASQPVEQAQGLPPLKASPLQKAQQLQKRHHPHCDVFPFPLLLLPFCSPAAAAPPAAGASSWPRPVHRATTGVSATVGGNRTGDSAL